MAYESGHIEDDLSVGCIDFEKDEVRVGIHFLQLIDLAMCCVLRYDGGNWFLPLSPPKIHLLHCC